MEDTKKHIKVVFNGVKIAETRRAKRVLETSHPPVYDIPPADIEMEYLVPTEQTSWCEWKGQAKYYTLVADGKTALNAAWSYPNPTASFITIKDDVALYPQAVDAC